MDPAELRAQFPVFEHLAYLNAGTCGPLPAAAVHAGGEVLAAAAAQGRSSAYFQQNVALRQRLRAAYAALIGAEPDDVALTTSTGEGIVRVLTGLDLRRGDEVLTSDEEHPGVFGPLAAARRRLGIVVRSVPFEQLADAVTPATRLVVCSHVAWISGKVAPDFTGLEVPVLLDGAQGAGAVEVDVGALGCAFYAAAGQKWLCGPVGSGFLHIAPAWREHVPAIGPTHINLASAAAGLTVDVLPTASRHDASALSLESGAMAAAAFVVLAEFGWPRVYERAATLAATLAELLTERGHVVAPRGATTLVAWEDPDPAATVARLAAAGVIIRSLPGTPLLRASVGAWNDESDLERLLGLLAK